MGEISQLSMSEGVKVGIILSYILHEVNESEHDCMRIHVQLYRHT